MLMWACPGAALTSPYISIAQRAPLAIPETEESEDCKEYNKPH